MLRTCASSITEFLFDHCDLPAGKKAVYIYGSELLVSTSLSMCSILVLSAFFGNLIAGAAFLAVFISLRLFVGGFHAKTYRNCFILTNGVFLFTLGVSALFEKFEYPALQVVILAASVGGIWAFAPIRNHHHPLSENAYRRNKIIGRTLALILGTGISLLLLLGIKCSFRPIGVASIMVVAIMMIIPKLIERLTIRCQP